MNCRKCGAELRSEQKVCIVCGTRTVAGGNFGVEEKEPFQITRNMICAAAGVVLVLLIAITINALRTVPPDVVTKQWWEAMVSRNYSSADRFHAQTFTDQMQPDVSDTRALSDYIYDEVVNQRGTPTFGAPVYDNPTSPTTATVNIAIAFADGHTGSMAVDFTKLGRRWLISNLRY